MPNEKTKRASIHRTLREPWNLQGYDKRCGVSPADGAATARKLAAALYPRGAERTCRAYIAMLKSPGGYRAAASRTRVLR